MCHGVTRDFSLTAHRLWWPTWVFLRSPTTQQAGSCVSYSSWYDILFEPLHTSHQKPGRRTLSLKRGRVLVELFFWQKNTPKPPRSHASFPKRKMQLAVWKYARNPAGKPVPGLCLSPWAVTFEARFTNTDECVSSLKQHPLTWKHTAALHF